MRHKIKRCFLLSAVLLCFSCIESSAYSIKGTIKNVSACFYPLVYLEVINNINGIYATNPENVIASANIDSLGNFEITGNDLPKEKRYYRLSLTNNANTKSTIYVGLRRNYFLLLLDNEANVGISCNDFCTDYFNYTVSNSPENAAIMALQNIINGYKVLYAGHDSLSKRKMEFVATKEKEDYRHFSDTCKYPLVALLAVSEMGLKNNYDEDAHFFNAFLGRLLKEAPTSIYTKQYGEELQLHNLRAEARGGVHAKDYILYVLLFCSLTLNIFFILKSRKPKQQAAQPVPNDEVNTNTEESKTRPLIESLSIKEREILLMINSGLSNKEIAGTLNVELSTIKTHVSNIYQKTGIKSRKEVAAIVRYMQ